MGLRFSAQAVIGLVILFFVSWRLTLVMLGVVPAVVVAAVVFGRRLRALGKTYQVPCPWLRRAWWRDLFA